jgi:hypothetical protein
VPLYFFDSSRSTLPELDVCFSDNPPPANPVKEEPIEIKEVVPEDDSKYQRRRPVRKASKKMLQDHNPELVGT